MSNKLPYAGYVAYKVRELPKDEQQVERAKYYGNSTRGDKFLEYIEYCRVNGYEAEKPSFQLPDKPLPIGAQILAGVTGFVIAFVWLFVSIIAGSVKRGKYY